MAQNACVYAHGEICNGRRLEKLAKSPAAAEAAAKQCEHLQKSAGGRRGARGREGEGRWDVVAPQWKEGGKERAETKKKRRKVPFSADQGLCSRVHSAAHGRAMQWWGRRRNGCAVGRGHAPRGRAAGRDDKIALSGSSVVTFFLFRCRSVHSARCCPPHSKPCPHEG